MVDRHDRQILARHLRDEAPPEAGADDDIGRLDVAAGGVDALDAAVLDVKAGAGRVGHGLQLAGFLRVADHLSGDDLGAGDHQARIRIPEPTLDHVFFHQRHQLFHLLGRDHFDPAAEGAPGTDPALEFAHSFVVALAGHLDAADARVTAALFEKVDAVPGREDRDLVVHRIETEVRCVTGRADIGRDA